VSRRRFGQHFLSDQSLIHEIIDLAGVGRDNTVLEIGTGTGNITRELARVAKHVISYEVDKRLWSYAKATLTDLSNVSLVNDDFRNCSNPFDILVASLPFCESADFITWLAQREFTRSLVILQKEFAKKLVASIGSHSYRSVSVISQMRFNVEELRTIPPSYFQPKPRVWAEMVRLTPKTPPFSPNQIHLIKSLFSFRGRTLGAFLRHRNLLTSQFDEDLTKKRVEEISPIQLREVIFVLDKCQYNS
jgi:16S rRNA (adenine1518-N6/adenine1519-N6)-dimethyltransferase